MDDGADSLCAYYRIGDINFVYTCEKGKWERVIIGIPNVVRQQKKEYFNIPTVITLYRSDAQLPHNRGHFDLSTLDSSVRKVFDQLPNHVKNVIEKGVIWDEGQQVCRR
jgi:hypothetical protein